MLLALAVGLGLHIATLHRAASDDERHIVELTGRLERQASLLRVLQAREVEIVTLEAFEVNPRGYGKIIWDVESRTAVLQVANLPVAAGGSYQLWIFPEEGAPLSAGVFAVNDPERDTFFRLAEFTPIAPQAIRGFVITLETQGGAPQPSDARYLGGRGPS